MGAAVAVQLAIAGAPAGAQDLTSSDAAERTGRAEPGRWVPSIAVISGVTVQDWKGSAAGSLRPGPTISNPNPPLRAVRPPVFGTNRDVTPFVGGNIELMSPVLPIPTGPRFFIGAEMFNLFGVDRRVAKERDPSILGNPLPLASQGQATFGDGAAFGQGTKVEVTIDSLAYGAHAGLAFPFEILGRSLRIKPAFAWMRYRIKVQGLMVDAQCRPLFFGTGGCEPNAGGFSRNDPIGIRLESKTSKTFEGIGPGLDLELDAFRWGPLGASIFLSGRLYMILGNRQVVLRTPPQTFSDVLGTGDTASAIFTFSVSDTMYRAGGGLRFHWLGRGK